MAKLMSVQIEILKGTKRDKSSLNVLIRQRGAYLRQLAYGVINGNYQTETAARLLLNY